MKIAMIGCGRLGLPCAEVLATKHTVTGYDPVETSSPHFELATTLKSATHDADYILVAVPTPHDPAYGGETPTSNLPPKDFDYSILRETLEQIAQNISPNQCVAVISTILPGSLRSLISDLPDMNVIYNPYLIAIGTVQDDMRNPDITIIGTEQGIETEFSKGLLAVYQSVGIDTKNLFLGTWEEAEAVKIFYNTFISWKIVFSNMILDVSEEIGNMNVDAVTGALSRCNNRIISPKYLVAGMGDGGACHPRDNIALSHLSDRLDLGYDLFGEISRAREKQAEGLANRLVGLAKERNLPIVIVGRSYKPGVPFEDGSYSLLIGHYIEKSGLIVEYSDPLTGHKYPYDKPAIFLRAHSAKVTYGTSSKDILANSLPPGSVLVDPWREVSPSGVDIIRYGNTRSGESSS